MNEDQFQDWKESPVSEIFFDHLKKEIEAEPERLAAIGASLGFPNSNTEALRAESAGIVARGFAYRELLDLTSDDLTGGDND